MLDITWWLFVVASLLVIALPGQDLVLVMSRSLTQGPAAGVITAGGVSCGLLLHTVLATVGVGAIVRASEWLFLVMKLAGAAYLIYLGIGLLRDASAGLSLRQSRARSLPRLFCDGAISNIANPKIAVFYFAFLPQFIGPDTANPTLAVAILGASFAFLTFLVKAPIGFAAGQLSALISAKPASLIWLYRVSGVSLILLAARLAFEKSPAA